MLRRRAFAAVRRRRRRGARPVTAGAGREAIHSQRSVQRSLPCHHHLLRSIHAAAPHLPSLSTLITHTTPCPSPRPSRRPSSRSTRARRTSGFSSTARVSSRETRFGSAARRQIGRPRPLVAQARQRHGLRMGSFGVPRRCSRTPRSDGCPPALRLLRGPRADAAGGPACSTSILLRRVRRPTEDCEATALLLVLRSDSAGHAQLVSGCRAAEPRGPASAPDLLLLVCCWHAVLFRRARTAQLCLPASWASGVAASAQLQRRCLKPRFSEQSCCIVARKHAPQRSAASTLCHEAAAWRGQSPSGACPGSHSTSLTTPRLTRLAQCTTSPSSWTSTRAATRC